jgi:cobalt/nickel transport system permease protein
VLALLIFLVCVGIANRPLSLGLLGFAACGALIAGSIPAGSFARRLLILLPIPVVFAVIVLLSGQPERAAVLLSRSVLSLTAILVTVTCTPIPEFFSALTWAKAPALLIEVVQFVYRYLFVLAQEIRTIRQAAASRGGSGSFVAAASGVSVLFARPYSRAEAIHRAMLSRSFSGLLLTPLQSRADLNDVVFLGVTSCWSIASVAIASVR